MSKCKSEAGYRQTDRQTDRLKLVTIVLHISVLFYCLGKLQYGVVVAVYMAGGLWQSQALL